MASVHGSINEDLSIVAPNVGHELLTDQVWIEFEELHLEVRRFYSEPGRRQRREARGQ